MMCTIITALAAAALIHGAVSLPNAAIAQTPTKAQQCEASARSAADSASSTGGGRGAARGCPFRSVTASYRGTSCARAARSVLPAGEHRLE
jgi:hypothetical protein